MEMPDQSWTAAGASFLGMWTLMTVAMMLPSLVPMLVRYRRDVGGASAMLAGVLMAVLALGYFGVWLAIGVVVLPFTSLIPRLPLFGVAGIVSLAVAYQLTERKARDLACCRHMLRHARPRAAGAGTALREGVRYGIHCVRCCANLMAIPLVLGTMSLWVMVLVGAVIAMERTRAA